jgi:ATP-binding cassette subfamily B protein
MPNSEGRVFEDVPILEVAATEPGITADYNCVILALLMTQSPNNIPAVSSQPPKSIFGLLTQYKGLIVGVMVLGVIANGLTLVIPTIIAEVIDEFRAGSFAMESFATTFGLFSLGILLFTYIQSVVQTYASERVAKDMREQLVHKISQQNFSFVETYNPSKLLTNITSDIDSIKVFVAQAVATLVSSFVIIIGATIILFSINAKLAAAVMTIVPIIGIAFFLVFRLLRTLFTQSREVIDTLNGIISETIVGAALIRALNSVVPEHEKFAVANVRSKEIGLSILNLFSILVPLITFVASAATLIVVVLGGYYVISQEMTLGSFVAFNSYIGILIFPIITIGFISTIIAQASASYERVSAVLAAPDVEAAGTVVAPLSGAIVVTNVAITFDDKVVLEDVSFTVSARFRTAIIGPTGAGKTQLLNIMTGLTQPDSGQVTYDGVSLRDRAPDNFFKQIAIVFQDSIIFNTSVAENIAFDTAVSEATLKLAIDTAELDEFIDRLPEGLDTVVSERGSTLSGGQKQRLMLARALVLNPQILFLDDFTARVDTKTEQSILSNITKNYPDLTLVSITQKIAPIESYDQILLLMQGQLIASGTHAELIETSPEYMQIYNSQRSTNAYEL